ncbi:MAG: hypothetical protein ACO3JL_13750, partial [Myxococcota bacterium]
MPKTRSSLLALAVLAAPLGCTAGGGADDAGEAAEDAGTSGGGTVDGGTSGGGSTDGGAGGGGSTDGGAGGGGMTDGGAGGGGSTDGGTSGGGSGGGSCAAPIPLTCESGTATFDTANGGNGVDGYGCDPLFPDDYTGKEQVFAFTNPTAAVASVSATKEAAGFTTYKLFQLATNPCDGEAVCEGELENTLPATAPSAPLRFDVVPGATTFLAYDVRVADETTAFSLTVTCGDAVCGNGVIELDETCDDGDAQGDDGCSA